jgi:cobalamin biosynthesis protein CbiD
MKEDCGKFVIYKKINTCFGNTGEDIMKHYNRLYCKNCQKGKIVNLSKKKNINRVIVFSINYVILHRKWKENLLIN